MSSASNNVSCDPQFGIHRLVEQIKGRTSRVLRAECPSLESRLSTLWTNSYFVATFGGATLEVVKRYVENQKNAELRFLPTAEAGGFLGALSMNESGSEAAAERNHGGPSVMTDRHSMSDDEFLVESRGAVTVLTLNRPQARNALNGNLIAGIGATVLAAEKDPEIRALVLTAAGEKAFCSGMDLRAFSGGEDIGFGDTPENRAFQRLTRGKVEVPVIGAANGTAVGGGLELLLGCDLIVAAETAKFGLPEVQRGLFPGGGGTYIAERIPLGIALQLTLTGDYFTAARGYEIGLFNAVTPADRVLDTAIGFAERIAANGPLGVAACKELVRLSVTDPDKAADRLRYWQGVVFASADAKEGATAFMEKREPVWQGK